MALHAVNLYLNTASLWRLFCLSMVLGHEVGVVFVMS